MLNTNTPTTRARRTTRRGCSSFWPLVLGLVLVVQVGSRDVRADETSAPKSEVTSVEAAVGLITQADLRKHVGTLAADALEGREAGTRGGKAAAVYIVTHLEKIGLKPGGDDGSWYQGFGRDYRNILAVIPGSDEILAKEYILVGGHFDHVGYGRKDNSAGPIGYIHNGADDNASGTSALMEMAEAIQSLNTKPKRSILFVFWDAEEQGLLGSEHWAKRPTIPIERVKLAINIDMIGRLRKNSMKVYGSRTGGGLRRLFSERNSAKIKVDFDWDIERDSDHYPLAQKRIPYVMPYTLKHHDYHRPSDDIGKINYKGMERIARTMFGVVYDAANQDSLPEFRAIAMRETNRLRDSRAKPAQPKSRLGIRYRDLSNAVPDAENAAYPEAVEVTYVSPNSAAQLGGLKVGDHIKRFGGRPVNELPDFRTLVLAADSPAEVIVEREGESDPIELTLDLPGRGFRIGISFISDVAEPNAMILTRVVTGSAADAAGLAAGDRVYAVSGQEFADNKKFVELLNEGEAEAVLRRERNGQIEEITMKLPSIVAMPSTKPAS